VADCGGEDVEVGVDGIGTEDQFFDYEFLGFAVASLRQFGEPEDGG